MWNQTLQFIKIIVTISFHCALSSIFVYIYLYKKGVTHYKNCMIIYLREHNCACNSCLIFSIAFILVRLIFTSSSFTSSHMRKLHSTFSTYFFVKNHFFSDCISIVQTSWIHITKYIIWIRILYNNIRTILFYEN